MYVCVCACMHTYMHACMYIVSILVACLYLCNIISFPFLILLLLLPGIKILHKHQTCTSIQHTLNSLSTETTKSGLQSLSKYCTDYDEVCILLRKQQDHTWQSTVPVKFQHLLRQTTNSQLQEAQSPTLCTLKPN